MAYAQVWAPVEALLAQVDQRVSTYVEREGSELILPEVLMGPLALRLSRAAASYFGHEETFIDDAWKVFSNVTGLPSQALAYRDERYDYARDYTSSNHEGRRLPKPFETVVETMRRLRDVNVIESQTEEVSTSAILGGSTSYGRFFNVRGGTFTADASGGKVGDPSDLDLLIVLQSWDWLDSFVQSLERVPFLLESDVEEGIERANNFKSLIGASDSSIVFSQKYNAWPSPEWQGARPDQVDRISQLTQSRQDYKVSLHIVDMATFDRLILKGVDLEDDFKEIIVDYRVGQPSVKGMARGFDGFHEEFDYKITAVDGGNLVRLRTCDTIGRRYKPGFHQQLILPQFDERWDHTAPPIRRALLEFRWKLLDRLRFERNLYPLKQQKLSLCHVRYHVFSPHVKSRIDAYETEL